MGFGARAAKRAQVVRHNGILVNGKRVNIPSYQVQPGRRRSKWPRRRRRSCASRPRPRPPNRAAFPEWLEVDTKALKGKFKALPARAELPSTINESLIIELYSK